VSKIPNNVDSLFQYTENKTSYVDLRYGRIRERRINATDGKITSDLTSLNSGYGIRLLSDGIISFISIPELRFANEEIDKVLRIAKIVSKMKTGVSKLVDAPVIEISVAKKPKQDWKFVEKKEIEELVGDIHDYIRDKLNVEAKIETDFLFIQWTELFRNSEGSRVFQDYTYTVLTLTGRVLRDGTQVKYYQNFGGLGGLEVLPVKSFEQFDKFIEIINNLPQAKKVKPGKYPALLNEDIAWTLTHEVLGHSLEADNVLSGHSFSAGLLGMKIAPSSVSVLDDPYIETIGYYEYDSEGMKGKGSLLVDDGILTDFLHSRETAAAMGGESSANYRAYSYEFLPQIRMSNTFIEPKDFTLEELTEQVKNGIYICDGLGGSSEPQTGEYNVDSQYGRVITNGELGDYLIGFQLSGKITETLSLISAVGDRLLAQPGSCVKNNQRVFVGSVSPHIAISSMRVS